jgi:predicted dienelactone hydrolase
MNSGRAPLLSTLCVLLLLVNALGACGRANDPLPFAPASERTAPDPAVYGPFPVGVATLTLEDPSRDPNAPPRRLVTEVWYPAVDETRAALADPIASGAVYDLMTLLTDELRERLGDVRLPLLRTNALRGAAPRAHGAPFPLVVFSHGQGGIRWQSTFFTVQLASHGFVVVSPDHEGNTLADAFADSLSSPVEGFLHRPLDVSFLLDVFAPSTRSPASAVPPAPRDASESAFLERLKPIVDPKHMGVAGHSFGALTSLRVALLDARVAAIAVHAPPDATIAWVEQPASFAVDIPVLVAGGGLDRTLPYDRNVAPTFERLHLPRFLLNIKTGGHFTFSDLCRFNLGALAARAGFADIADTLDDGCTPPAPPGTLAQSLIDYFTIGFFNAALRNSGPSARLLTQARADVRWPGMAEVKAEW